MHKSTKNTIQKHTKSKDFEYFCVFSVFFRKKYLTECGQICDSSFAVAKSIAEPENSNYVTLANNSTPFYRAFFIRSARTSKERYNIACSSMVACSGKGFALCCVPKFAVSQPVTRYRPNPEKFSDSSKNLTLELSAMIYLFLGIHRQNLADTNRTFKTLPKQRLAVRAQSEQDARARIAPNWCILQSWAFQNPEEINRTFATSSNKGVIYA